VSKEIEAAQIVDLGPCAFEKFRAVHHEREALRAADRDIEAVRVKRNSVPRGASTPFEVVIDTMTTAASCP
jgi:hypothetical protein